MRASIKIDDLDESISVVDDVQKLKKRINLLKKKIVEYQEQKTK